MKNDFKKFYCEILAGVLLSILVGWIVAQAFTSIYAYIKRINRTIEFAEEFSSRVSIAELRGYCIEDSTETPRILFIKN